MNKSGSSSEWIPHSLHILVSLVSWKFEISRERVDWCFI